MQALSKKLAKVIYFLRLLKETVSLGYLRVAYFSFFHSVMTYAVYSWGHSAHSNKVFALQRRCMRVLCDIGYRYDCREYFKDLKVLTLPSVYILQCLTYAKRNADKFVTPSSIHPYSTRTNQQCRLPFLRLEKSRNGSNYFAVKLFNVLPAAIKCLSDQEFHLIIKNFLLNKCI